MSDLDYLTKVTELLMQTQEFATKTDEDVKTLNGIVVGLNEAFGTIIQELETLKSNMPVISDSVIKLSEQQVEIVEKGQETYSFLKQLADSSLDFNRRINSIVQIVQNLETRIDNLEKNQR